MTQVLIYKYGKVVGQVTQVVDVVVQVRQLVLHVAQVLVEVRYYPERQVKQFVVSAPEQLTQLVSQTPQV